MVASTLSSVTFEAAPYVSSNATVKRSVGEGYVFVDNIRFIAMATLFFEHTIYALDVELQQNMPWFSLLMICLTKFGTIGFFIVSGFLLGKNLETAGPIGYLKKRFDRIFLPWLFWFSIYTAGSLLYAIFREKRTFHSVSDVGFAVGHAALENLKHSQYWFVPHLFAALIVILLLRRYLSSIWLGAAFALVSLLYAANISYHWIPTRHTVAVFGFTFYLWLGYFVSNRLPTLRRWSACISTSSLVGLTVLLGCASFAEANLIRHYLPHEDPANSLRITNQLYSLVMVLLLFRITRPAWPSFVNVRNDTFGLYLLQAQALSVVAVLFNWFIRPLSAYALLQNKLGTMLLWAVVLSGTYLAALVITKLLLAHQTLRWTVGGAPLPR